MLTNIEPVENLRSLARVAARDFETRTVRTSAVNEALAEGWVVAKRGAQSARLTQPKPASVLVRDRVWTLMYRLGFNYLSNEAGADLEAEQGGRRHAISVVALDDEVAVVIQRASADEHGRRPRLEGAIEELAQIRSGFARAVRDQFPAPGKRQTVLAVFSFDLVVQDSEKAAAAGKAVQLVEDHDISYYESLVNHVGTAARYQFLADMLSGRPVPGLAVRIPAVKTRMGGTTCYTFSTSPAYFLKISYVSHRSKGQASDVNTYQRMLSKSRLNGIRDYISKDGIFPTNIVLNLDNQRLRFERIRQEAGEDVDPENGLLGWLDLRPTYKSAWIIDGQHRLYAYSGHSKAKNSRVSVLAFEGLPPSKQAELFIDINAKQKSVRQSLLQELYAELHWDAADPAVRVRAIISKVIQVLDADRQSAFYQRIQAADATKDPIRCITLATIYGALEKTDFFIAKKRRGQVVEFGPLWAGDNESTLKRTMHALRFWFNAIRDKAREWWDRGAGEGGGLAMNDSVASCISVLQSVFRHLDPEGHRLLHLSNDDLVKEVAPFAQALGEYLGTFSDEDRKRYRELRGIQGQTTRTKRAQQALHAKFPPFNPPGLQEFLQQEKAQTNAKAKAVIDRIETTLQSIIIEELRGEYTANDTDWWTLGVPLKIRKKATERQEEDNHRRGGKERYLDLVDYRDIVQHNWSVFEPLLAYGRQGSKDKRTDWMAFVNEKRRVVAHASSGMMLSIEDLEQLQGYEQWLNQHISGLQPSRGDHADDG